MATAITSSNASGVLRNMDVPQIWNRDTDMKNKKPLSLDKGGMKTNGTNKSVMVSVSFVRGYGKHKQGGRPGLSIEIDLQLRNSAGL
jgi:hypothetical protein